MAGLPVRPATRRSANKGSNYEGGLRVPAIIKWPGGGKAGATSGVPITSTDFYPTILAAIGQP